MWAKVKAAFLGAMFWAISCLLVFTAFGVEPTPTKFILLIIFLETYSAVTVKLSKWEKSL